jgi:hypothetical protein
MHRDPNSILCRIKRERTAIIGFLGGCLLFSLFAHLTLESLQPFEYTGVQYECVGFERLHHLRLDVLTALVTVVGGFASALAATDLQRNGWRFGLRSLLIATTLVALALGAVVAMSS